MTQRITWIDTAKGLAICFIVFSHSRGWLEFAGANSEWLLKLVEPIIYSAQVPLFFFMSGILSDSWIREKNWKEFFSEKLSPLIWCFIVWQPVMFLYKYMAALILPNQQDASLFDHLLRMIISPIRPNGELWFLWALILFFILAKLTRKIPKLLQILIAVLASSIMQFMTSSILSDEIVRILGNGFYGFFSFYIFFLVAYLFKDYYIKYINKLSNTKGLFFVFLWFFAIYFIPYFKISFLGSGLLVHSLAVVGGISLAKLLKNIQIFTSLGKQTLQIYLAHTFFIVLISCIIYLLSIDISNEIVAFILPFVLSIVVTFISIKMYNWMSTRKTLKYIYTPTNYFKLLFSKKIFYKKQTPKINI